jgi:hypothetical protein
MDLSVREGPHDDAEAANWYRKVADQGNAVAQFQLGNMYDSGKGVEGDHVAALRWWRKAAEQRNRPEETRRTEAAEGIYEEASLYLGFSYYDGQGVPQDYAEAMKWLRKSTPSEFGIAELLLGECYFYGRGVQQDYAEALRWYCSAADRGESTEASFNLGLMYAEGNGVPQDFTEAARWYRKAAEEGNAAAQYSLGIAYYHGQGLAQDYVGALKWCGKAAQQGHATAQYYLGLAYYNGKGVSQDYVEAYKWMDLAASASTEADQSKYSSARDVVATKMTPQQIAEAQRLAWEWKPGSPQ